MHTNGELGPYLYSYEAFMGIVYNQFLFTYVRTEAQQLPQVAVLHHDEALPHTSRTLFSLLNEVFPN